MTLKGIDVSQWQGNIDWQKVKGAGVQFTMLRAGYGRNNLDTKFHRNAQGAIAAGITIGLYWFSYALNVEMARKEAQYAAELAKKYKITWPIAFDLEYDTIDYAKKNGVTITKPLATQMAISFCEEIKRLGYIPMVYTNLDYLNRYFDRSKLPYDLWYAQYASAASVADKEIWQYSSKGSVPGIAGNVDMNHGYKDYGKDGGSKPDQEPAKPVANPIIKAGQAHARNFIAENLEADGIVGPETRKARVMVLQHALNLDYGLNITVDGIWGPKSENGFKNHGTRIAKTHYMVTALQILLNTHGYAAAVENPGEYTEELEEIVGKFQKDCGMFPDKIAGYKTFKALIS